MIGKIIVDGDKILYKGTISELHMNVSTARCLDGGRVYDYEKKCWVDTDMCFLTDKEHPYVACLTGNFGDAQKMEICRAIGAECIYSRNDITDYDEDPYGRKVARWKHDERIYDLRKFVGDTRDLNDVLPYELKSMVEYYKRTKNK